jgi:hypothetical protein
VSVPTPNAHPRPRSCAPDERARGLSLRGLARGTRTEATRVQSPADTLNAGCASVNNSPHVSSEQWERSNLDLLPHKQNS